MSIYLRWFQKKREKERKKEQKSFLACESNAHLGHTDQKNNLFRMIRTTLPHFADGDADVIT